MGSAGATAVARNAYLVAFMLVLISMMTMFGNVLIFSLRQAIIPEHLLGRAASAYRLLGCRFPSTREAEGSLVAEVDNADTPTLLSSSASWCNIKARMRHLICAMGYGEPRRPQWLHSSPCAKFEMCLYRMGNPFSGKPECKRVPWRMERKASGKVEGGRRTDPAADRGSPSLIQASRAGE
jgi:hypothetical protein